MVQVCSKNVSAHHWSHNKGEKKLLLLYLFGDLPLLGWNWRFFHEFSKQRWYYLQPVVVNVIKLTS